MTYSSPTVRFVRPALTPMPATRKPRSSATALDRAYDRGELVWEDDQLVPVKP